MEVAPVQARVEQADRRAAGSACRAGTRPGTQPGRVPGPAPAAAGRGVAAAGRAHQRGKRLARGARHHQQAARCRRGGRRPGQAGAHRGRHHGGGPAARASAQPAARIRTTRSRAADPGPEAVRGGRSSGPRRSGRVSGCIGGFRLADGRRTVRRDPGGGRQERLRHAPHRCAQDADRGRAGRAEERGARGKAATSSCSGRSSARSARTWWRGSARRASRARPGPPACGRRRPACSPWPCWPRAAAPACACRSRMTWLLVGCDRPRRGRAACPPMTNCGRRVEARAGELAALLARAESELSAGRLRDRRAAARRGDADHRRRGAGGTAGRDSAARPAGRVGRRRQGPDPRALAGQPGPGRAAPLPGQPR